MLLLALETVTRAGSLALCDAESCESALGNPEQTHGVRLPGELTRFITTRNRQLADVDAFVVVTGPGSFTGLRVGLATIQGLALAQQRPAIGIPTLEAMVSGFLDHAKQKDDLVLACLDDARGDIFYALCDVSGADHFDAAQWLIEPAVDKPGAAAARVGAALAGRACRAVGDAAVKYADVFQTTVPELVIESVMPNLAEGAARLAHRRGSHGESPHALHPIYIRRTDAELARDRANAPIDLDISQATDAAGRAEVAALQARVFGHGWGAEGLAGGEANREIAKVHVARQRSGKLIAFSVIWLVLDELHIHSIAVDPGFVRRGVAKTLLQRVLDESRASGATSATLEVRASNTAARSLYEGFGFHVEAVRPAYYENPIEDALILWRRKL